MSRATGPPRLAAEKVNTMGADLDYPPRGSRDFVGARDHRRLSRQDREITVFAPVWLGVGAAVAVLCGGGSSGVRWRTGRSASSSSRAPWRCPLWRSSRG